MMFIRGRRRQVDTTGHFCPQAACSYHGWADWGNIRANGHPNWASLFLTDGNREYLTELVTHYSHWIQSERRQAQGSKPKPRWMHWLGLLYSQVVKLYRCWRIVGGKHRVIFSAAETHRADPGQVRMKINTAS